MFFIYKSNIYRSFLRNYGGLFGTIIPRLKSGATISVIPNGINYRSFGQKTG